MLLASQRNLAAAATPVPAAAQSTDRCTRRSRASSAESGLHKTSSKIRCVRLFNIFTTEDTGPHRERPKGNPHKRKENLSLSELVPALACSGLFFSLKICR